MTQAIARAEQVLAHLTAHGPRLGTTTLVCIDGPSGSGKTTLADELAELVPATVLRTDAFCPGWAGLPQLSGILFDLCAALAEGHAGQVREWDWGSGGPGELRVIDPAPVLVLEGVGSGSRRLAPWITTLVSLDGDPGTRKARALARDDYFAAYWDAWAETERTYFETDQVRERAHLSFRTDLLP